MKIRRIDRKTFFRYNLDTLRKTFLSGLEDVIMKRSKANDIIQYAIDVMKKAGYPLPPFP